MTTDYNALYRLVVDIKPELGRVPGRHAATLAHCLELVAGQYHDRNTTRYHFGENNTSAEDFISRLDVERMFERVAIHHGFKPGAELATLALAMFTIVDYYEYGGKRPTACFLAIPRINGAMHRVDAYCSLCESIGLDLASIVLTYLWVPANQGRAAAREQATLAGLTPFRRWILTRYGSPKTRLPYIDDLMKEMREHRPDIAAVTPSAEIEAFIATECNVADGKPKRGAIKDDDWSTDSRYIIRRIRHLLARFGL